MKWKKNLKTKSGNSEKNQIRKKIICEEKSFCRWNLLHFVQKVLLSVDKLGSWKWNCVFFVQSSSLLVFSECSRWARWRKRAAPNRCRWAKTTLFFPVHHGPRSLWCRRGLRTLRRSSSTSTIMSSAREFCSWDLSGDAKVRQTCGRSKLHTSVLITFQKLLITSSR